MTQNWGFMTLSPIPTGHLFNTFYGLVFDSHSLVKSDGSRDCKDGIDCYRGAYVVTLIAACVGLMASLASVRYDRTSRRGAGKEKAVYREP